MHRPPRDEPSFSGIFSRTFLLALLVALLALFLMRTFFTGSLLVPDAEARPITPRGDLAASEETTIALFEAAAPSVVHIQTARIRTQRGFFTMRQLEVPEGAGSGFLWDEDGHVVTNYHVIQNADTADVILNDGETYTARLVGAAPDSDLAVLRIDAFAHALKPLPIGTSADLRVGQTVLAIGNPYGLEQTLTTGIISGLNRSIVSITGRPIHGVIQTDAAINPGNSGGPLLDSAGRLVGINTAIKSPTGAYAGIGFAVPVDTVNRLVPRILREGLTQRAGLGVYLGDDAWSAQTGVEGAIIDRVVPGSAADAAGLQGVREVAPGRFVLGDAIVGLDGEPVRSRDELLERLERYAAGDRVTLRVRRPTESGERLLDLEVRLQALR